MATESLFYSWISEQRKQRTPIGDLARDIKRDDSFPIDQQDIEHLHGHLSRKSACLEAHCALDEAFRRFNSPKPTRRSLSLKIRFLVFKQCNYSCQICGLSANEGARLEVDHKLPKAKGGTDEIENLWALCFECNRGKGANDL